MTNQQIPTREERLEIAIDAGDVGTWEWSVSTGEVTWTPTLERIHGFAPGSFGGTFDVYLSYILEEDRQQVLDAIQRAVSGEAPYEVEYRMYKPDGSMHWVAARGRVFRDGEGRPQTVMGICMDVTERRRATDALRLVSDASTALASSLDYEKTLNTVARLCVPHLGDWCVVDVLRDDGQLSRVAVAHRDPGKEVLARELEERYPASPDAPNGPLRVVHSGAIEFVPDIPLELLRANARDEDHFRILVSLGMRSYICLPLVARGRTLGALTVINAESRRSHDSNDLRLAEELGARAALAIDNARLYRKSLEASRAKDEFLATLSHELRTPMTAVLGFAALLEKGDGDEQQVRSAIQAIKSSAQAQARLIEDVLEVSGQIMGKVRLDITPMNLVAAIRAAAETIAPAARAKGVSVRVDAVPAECMVAADPDRIQQVLWNLTTNALKFTPAGGTISLELQHSDDAAIVQVRDTGAGIPPAFLPHVFERFRQGPSTRKQEGLGLGLAIVHHLVELHGGSVEAFSEGEGKGATFTVRLPLLKGHYRPVPADDAPLQQAR